VVSDQRAFAVKGQEPIVPLAERVEIVRAIRHVDHVVVEDVSNKLEMWHRLHFDVIIKGDDWRGTPKGDALERDFAPLGVEIVYLPYTVHTSSTMLRQVLHRRVANS
jgi:glycerol-3-phosphate cytidylyltransferase